MDKENPKVKILIAYHRQSELLKSEVYTPIHVGRDIAMRRSKDGLISKENFQWLTDNMIGDNTGDNISYKNLKYNELTALYWAWKNYEELGDPDYIGLMHYRRHFIFNTEKPNPSFRMMTAAGLYPFVNMTPDYLEFIEEKYIPNYFPENDCLVIDSLDVKRIGRKNCRAQFASFAKQDVKNFDICCDTVKSLYPDFSDAIDKLYTNSKLYVCNMFVMKKELFFEYCSFIFTVLEKLENTLEINEDDPVASRTLGFLGEFLLTVFVLNLQSRPGVNVAESGASIVLSPDSAIIKKYWIYRILRYVTWGVSRYRYQCKCRVAENYFKQTLVM